MQRLSQMSNLFVFCGSSKKINYNNPKFWVYWRVLSNGSYDSAWVGLPDPCCCILKTYCSKKTRVPSILQKICFWSGQCRTGCKCALGCVNAKVKIIQILKKMYAYTIFVGDCINCLDHRAMLTMIPTQSTFVARGWTSISCLTWCLNVEGNSPIVC